MSFTSIREIAYDKNKQKCIFLVLICVFMQNLVFKENKMILNESVFRSYDFNELNVSNVYNRL